MTLIEEMARAICDAATCGEGQAMARAAAAVVARRLREALERASPAHLKNPDDYIDRYMALWRELRPLLAELEGAP